MKKIIKKLFLREYDGRGITLFILIDPQLNKSKEKKLFRELASITSLKENFNKVLVTNHGKEEKNRNWVKIFCPLANFTLKKSEISEVYGNLYLCTMHEVKDIVNKNKFKLVGFSFEIVWTIPERENIIPMFELTLPKIKIDD